MISPTPKWDYAYTVEDTIDPDLKYPLIVKPGNALNSMGITNGSVVTNKVQLRKQIKRIIEELRRPALIEEYVEGEEFSVSILGTDDEDLRVLPLTRSVFKKMPKGKWNIYTEKEKQRLAGENKNIIVQYPLKNVSKKLESLLTEIALDTYKTMRCRDYGRVEIRLDKDDNPYVLEINTNPFLDNPAHLFKSAEVTGMKTGDLIEEIIRLSLSRFNRKKRTYYSDLISK
jgi:D-alanine-D-alanine ligase